MRSYCKPVNHINGFVLGGGGGGGGYGYYDHKRMDKYIYNLFAKR